MSPNEEFVLDCLSSELGGEIREGEDPPDAYLIFEEKTVAVEVTRLVEQVTDADGNTVSRLRHDVPAANLSNELSESLDSLIPDNQYVFLILPSPILDIRSTRAELSKRIVENLKSGTIREDIKIGENDVSIYIYEGSREKKVISALASRYSSANITQNSLELLEDRLIAKSAKCNLPDSADEYWLALYNDYWIADADSYRHAYESLNIAHPFSRLYLINSGAEVHLIRNLTCS